MKNETPRRTAAFTMENAGRWPTALGGSPNTYITPILLHLLAPTKPVAMLDDAPKTVLPPVFLHLLARKQSGAEMPDQAVAISDVVAPVPPASGWSWRKLARLKFFSLAGLVLAGGGGSLAAQSITLARQVISGGGGASSNATVTVSGSIGQWGSSAMSGGGLAVSAGFWGATESVASYVLVSSANPALPGANVTFTMTLVPEWGTGTPSGTVNFRIDGNATGSGALSGGVASFTTHSLTHGAHTITGEYGGDANFYGITNSLTPSQMINTPPVAGNVTIYRNPAGGTNVAAATLLASDSDADGDALTLSVSPTSAHNGTVTLSGGVVAYTPAAGFTNVDSFNYAVTDGFGGSASGTVTVNLQTVSSNPGPTLALTTLANGAYLITGTGVPGYTYRLQYSATLPATAWVVLGSAKADGTGKFAYTNSTAATTRFYRTIYP